MAIKIGGSKCGVFLEVGFKPDKSPAALHINDIIYSNQDVFLCK
jgi:hypothetical protein